MNYRTRLQFDLEELYGFCWFYPCLKIGKKKNEKKKHEVYVGILVIISGNNFANRFILRDK